MEKCYFFVEDQEMQARVYWCGFKHDYLCVQGFRDSAGWYKEFCQECDNCKYFVSREMIDEVANRIAREGSKAVIAV